MLGDYVEWKKFNGIYRLLPQAFSLKMLRYYKSREWKYQANKKLKHIWFTLTVRKWNCKIMSTKMWVMDLKGTSLVQAIKKSL